MAGTEPRRRVAIVGAGISGLLACKYALSKGFQPMVFESRDCEGGLWTKTLYSTRLQSPKSIFQFSDFPWPPSMEEEFPRHDRVLRYLQSYARHFDLLRHIRFNCRIVGIDLEGASVKEMRSWDLWGGSGEPFSSAAGKWRVTVEDRSGGSTQMQFLTVDFVILCVGRFSDVPNIPEFPAGEGPEVFEGKVIHSTDYAGMDPARAAELVRGKRVTVVGMQKYGLDIAMECAKVNGVDHPCTMVYRSVSWPVPDFFPWGINLGYFYLTRFSELLVHKPAEGALLSLLAAALYPLRWGVSKFVETYIRWKVPLAKHGMVPAHNLCHQFDACQLAILPEGFYGRVEEGSIVLKKCLEEGFRFCNGGIILAPHGGDAPPFHPTDVVILATGFRGDLKLRDIFDSPIFRDLAAASPTAAIPFYRGCIHPRIPQLAVIGYWESFANLFTSEMECRWVTEMLAGRFRLPEIREMEEETARWGDYMKRQSGRDHRRSCIALLHIWYSDLLCRDMGWNPLRKKGWLADWFQPYGPLDYSHP